MKRRDPIASLAVHLKGRDVRAIIRGALDRKTWWVMFGPAEGGGYRVERYVRRKGQWQPDGDSVDAGEQQNDGWDMLGALFVRAFTEAA